MSDFLALLSPWTFEELPSPDGSGPAAVWGTADRCRRVPSHGHRVKGRGHVVHVGSPSVVVVAAVVVVVVGMVPAFNW
jgi:hypothetical protein